MHALGYWHEQQRPDRDEHIQIHRDRCFLTDNAFDVNFGSIGEKWNRNLDNAYDLRSIMHYSPGACSMFSGPPVFTHPNGTEFDWQEPVELSPLDIEGINKAYPCSKRAKPTDPPKPPPSDNIRVHAANLKLTAVSKERRLWTFAPNHHTLDTADWTGDKKLDFLVYFDNLTPDEIRRAKNATLIFFRYQMPNDDASCLVDRFDAFPLQ